MADLVQLIEESHSGTKVYNIDGYNLKDSLLPMWEQVEGIKEKMLPIMQNATDGVNLICFSQGKSGFSVTQRKYKLFTKRDFCSNCPTRLTSTE